jgi:hypothetical protein
MTSTPREAFLAAIGDGTPAEPDAEMSAAMVRAAQEGRIDGKYRCPRCGMRSNIEEEAATCCEELGPPSSERVSDSRFHRSK